MSIIFETLLNRHGVAPRALREDLTGCKLLVSQMLARSHLYHRQLRSEQKSKKIMSEAKEKKTKYIHRYIELFSPSCSHNFQDLVFRN